MPSSRHHHQPTAPSNRTAVGAPSATPNTTTTTAPQAGLPPLPSRTIFQTPEQQLAQLQQQHQVQHDPHGHAMGLARMRAHAQAQAAAQRQAQMQHQQAYIQMQQAAQQQQPEASERGGGGSGRGLRFLRRRAGDVSQVHMQAQTPSTGGYHDLRHGRRDEAQFVAAPPGARGQQQRQQSHDVTPTAVPGAGGPRPEGVRHPRRELNETVIHRQPEIRMPPPGFQADESMEAEFDEIGDESLDLDDGGLGMEGDVDLDDDIPDGDEALDDYDEDVDEDEDLQDLQDVDGLDEEELEDEDEDIDEVEDEDGEEVDDDEECAEQDAGKTDEPIPSHLREISSLASWTVSTYKPGCGVSALRDPSPSQFWQSDGPQPHTLTLHFFKLVSIVKLRVYLDFELDESYTPTKMIFLAGMGGNDLVEFAVWESEGENGSGMPNGWIDIPLIGVGGDDQAIDDDANGFPMKVRNRDRIGKKGAMGKREKRSSKAAELQTAKNKSLFQRVSTAKRPGPKTPGTHATGSPSKSHWREAEELDSHTSTSDSESDVSTDSSSSAAHGTYAPPRHSRRRRRHNLASTPAQTTTPGSSLKAMVLQVKVCENHQNGKDTHVRGFQVFARDEKRRRLDDEADGNADEEAAEAPEDGEGSKTAEERAAANAANAAKKKGATSRIREAEWMGEVELR